MSGRFTSCFGAPAVTLASARPLLGQRAMMERWREHGWRVAVLAWAALLLGLLPAAPLLAQTAPAAGDAAPAAQAAPEPLPIALPSAASNVKNPAVELPGLPEDADVFINGSLKGRGLKRVEVILPGTYEVLVRRKGFRPWTKSVTLGDAQTVQVQPDYVPLKLAIMPILWSGTYPAGQGKYLTENWVTRAIAQAAEQTALAVSHSANMSAYIGTDVALLPFKESDAWTFAGNPREDFAVSKGKELDVDAVLFIRLGPQPGASATGVSQAFWSAALVDPRTRAITKDTGTLTFGARQSRNLTREISPLLERYVNGLIRASGKQTMVVLDLEGEEAAPGAVHAIGEALREELRNTGRYTVMDRSEEAAILDRLAPKQTTCTAVECALQAGKLFGVQKVVAGRVTGLSATSWKVAVIQVDVATGETISSESIRHSGSLGSAGKSLAPLADDLAVAASPAGVTFRYEQSKWRWKTGLAMGGAAVMALASAYLAAEVTASNERQKDDRIQAENSGNFKKWEKKLQDEKSTGESLRNQTIAAEVIFAGLAWYAFSVYRNPPELAPVAYQFQPVPTRDGGFAVALNYSW